MVRDVDDYADQLRTEFQGQYNALTDRIAALDKDIARCTESEQRLVLQSRRNDLVLERRGVTRQLTALENGLEASIEDSTGKTSRRRGRKVKRMDNDELTRLVYEIRSDVQILTEQFLQIKSHYSRETAGIPPQALALLIGLGLVTLVLLSFMTLRIGL